MPMLSSSCMASSFSWCWSLSSCFCANLWILLDTTSTSRSLSRSLFLMYQGALTMFLSNLFWNRCIMSILLCLVQPHSWILYVQKGFNTCVLELISNNGFRFDIFSASCAHIRKSGEIRYSELKQTTRPLSLWAGTIWRGIEGRTECLSVMWGNEVWSWCVCYERGSTRWWRLEAWA
jgi:hypothetical protein